MLLSIISIAIGILGILLAIIFYGKSKKRTELSYYINADIELIGNNVTSMQGIEVKYKETNVRNLDRTEIVFKNTGDNVIEFSNIAKTNPLIIQLSIGILHGNWNSAPNNPKIFDILEYHITPNSPQSINAHLKKLSNSKLQILFDFIRPNEAFTVSFLRCYNGDAKTSCGGFNVKGEMKVGKIENIVSMNCGNFQLGNQYPW